MHFEGPILANEVQTNHQKRNQAMHNAAIAQVGRGLPHRQPVSSPLTLEEGALSARRGYWNQYYSRPVRRVPPSQFAAFVANEYSDHELVVDVGCGNGRDSVFFAQLGFRTMGIDAADVAVTHCRSLIEGSDRPEGHNQFLCRNVLDLRDDPSLAASIRDVKKIIYSRFFLHAIDIHEEQAFFDFAFASMKDGDVLAVEFRTSQDAGRAKVTGAHYRRYVDSSDLVQAVVDRHGAQVLYLTEGTGFAKYKADDAHVCRLVLGPAKS